VLQPEDLARQLQQALADLRGADAPAGAVEQLHLVQLLQLLDLGGHRGLAHVQGLRRAREAALRGHGMEGSQLCQAHDIFLRVIPGQL